MNSNRRAGSSASNLATTTPARDTSGTESLAVSMSVADNVTLSRLDGLGPRGLVWPGAQSTRYLSPTAFPAGSEPDELYLSAMGQWSSVPAADFQYFYVRLDEDYPIDHFFL